MAGAFPDVGARGAAVPIGLAGAERGCGPVAVAADAADDLWFNGVSRPQFVTYNVTRLPRSSIARARDRLPVIGWTVRCGHVLSRVLGQVDALIVEGAGIPVLTADGPASGPCSVACA